MVPSRLRRLLVLGLVLSAAPLHGQSTDTVPRLPPRQEESVKVVPSAGLRYGAPLGASVYAGATLGSPDPMGYTGPSVVAEVGQDGVRASLGVASLSLAGTLRAQLSVIRTWDDHGDVLADQTYLGPEVTLGIIVGVTLGYYWRISDGGGPARFFAVGSAIGA